MYELAAMEKKRLFCRHNAS